jgi:hypothetical protein
MSSDERFPYSRRAIVGAGSIGLVAAAAPAFAQNSKEQPLSKQSETPAPEGLQDPRTKYPKPPFRRQQQPWPGLASRMDPRPDHGETSYRGSGRLAGRKALITCGDSGMGRAAAIAFAREGADVAINHLPAEEEDAREVIELMKAEGRTALSIPGIYATKLSASASSRKLWTALAALISSSATRDGNRPAPRSSTFPPRILMRP